MTDLIRIGAALLVGYLAAMTLAIILIKIIFPFLTETELKRQKSQKIDSQ